MALHAHPDDESLLTGGTLVALAAAGHRVVLVVATDGGRGLTAPGGGSGLGGVRSLELVRAASALGVARTVRLGYADSGDAGAAPDGFCHVDVTEVADRVAAILREESADLLLGYDHRGGYGHPDHRHVHAVAEAAAAAGGVRLLHATVDRTWLNRGVRLAARCRLLPAGVEPDAASRWYSDRDEITHRVRVWRVAGAKHRALRCHGSQETGGGGSVRTVRLLARLPRPVFALVAGTEWYVEPGGARGVRPLSDPLVAARRPTA